MSRQSVRIRRFLSDAFVYLVLVFVALALVGGYVTYGTHVDPGTEVETFEESSWSSTAEYSHHAVVQRETDVFEEGTVLENRPAYLVSIAPVLEGTHEYDYRATGGGDVTVTVEQTRVLRSVGDDGEFEYWREEEHLTTETEESVEPDEAVAVPFSVNVTEASVRVDEIEAQLDGTPGTTEILVESRLHLDGERNGQPVDETVVHEMGIDDQGDVYSVETEQLTDSGQQMGQEEVTATYGPLRTIGSPLLLVVSLVGLLGLAVGHWQQRLEVTEDEREWLAYRKSVDEFEEWVSTGSLSEDALARTTIQVENLEDLVDVAIDSNRRVIRDRSRDLCAVLLEDTVYTFEPPGQPKPAADHDQLETTATSGQSVSSDDESADDSEGLLSAIVSTGDDDEGETEGDGSEQGTNATGTDSSGVDSDEDTDSDTKAE